jgi:hypothetical protein
MIPGTTTKLSEELLASAATINPTKDLVILSGTTALVNITPHFGGGFSGILFIVPTNAAGVATSAAGNIAVVVTMPQFRPTMFVYSKLQNKWYPGPIS